MLSGGDFRDLKERDHRPKLIQSLLVQSTRRRWQHLAEERLDTVEPKIPLGPRFWALTQQEHKELARLVESEEIRPTLASLKGRDKDASVALIDAAYWRKGCSSLGRLRYAALLRISEDGESRTCLIDIKEEVTAAAPRAKGAKMPKDNAERVVAGARALSPNLGQRLMAAKLFGKSVVIRELMPQDLKVEIETLGITEALLLARYLASVVGRAHGRQMDPRDRSAWRAELKKRSTSSMDAPSWLWQSVVELASFTRRLIWIIVGVTLCRKRLEAPFTPHHQTRLATKTASTAKIIRSVTSAVCSLKFRSLRSI
jgi:uncharacterized protein (DUF2252 family)